MEVYIQTALFLLIFTIPTQCETPQPCTDNQSCMTADGETGICLNTMCKPHISYHVRNNLSFTITVKYPELNIQQHGGVHLYIRGNGLGLTWYKGVELIKHDTDTWSTTVTYSSSVDGLRCQTCADHTRLPGDVLEYRLLVDDLVDMIGANMAIQFPLSEVSDYFNTKPTILAYPWFYSKIGSMTSVKIQSSEIGGNRSIAIYRPPSFSENNLKTYPVLMAFDLEPDSSVMPIFDDAIVTNAVSEEFVLVGFGDYQGDHNARTNLLTQSVGVTLGCLNGSFADRCNGCLPQGSMIYNKESLELLKNKCGKPFYNGGNGDKTLDFMIDTVLPKVNILSNNRLTSDRNKIGIMGYSVGGLMSCYAAWTRPHIFGFAACQSPSLWWPFNNATMTTCDFSFLNETLTDPKYQQNRPPQRIYLDVGGAEAAEPFLMKHSIVEVARVITQHENYVLNKNIWVNVIPGATHVFHEWKVRMWVALKTLLPAQGSPNMPNKEMAPLVG